MIRIIPLVAALFGAALIAPAPASAQEAFPQKPIEVTVLFPAGSSADITARLLADGMSRQLATNVIVVNRPGAGGAIGYQAAARKAPDGYSLVWNSNSISTAYHSGALGFNYEAFDAVAQALIESPLLAVRREARWSSLAALLADARARPKEITVANSGVGSHTHIAAVALFRTAGVQTVDVPYGAAQVVTSLVGGEVDAAVQLPAALSEYVKVGQLRLLAALTAERDPAFAATPTAREQGVDVSLEAWRGIAVPKGTPTAIIAALEAAIRKTVESPAFIQACGPLGVRPAFLPAGAFGRRIAREDAELAHLIEIIGLKKS